MKSLDIGKAELWAQFGLSGLVIFALFVSMVTIVLFTIRKMDKIDTRNTEAYTNQAAEHRSERNEWRRDSNRSMDKFEKSMNKLTEGIQKTKI